MNYIMRQLKCKIAEQFRHLLMQVVLRLLFLPNKEMFMWVFV